MFELSLQLPSGQTLPCAVVAAPRSKYVRVRLNLQGELHLLVPAHRQITPAEAQTILQDMHPWIEKALRRFQKQGAEPQPPLTVPDTIALPALNQQWQVCCVSGPANSTHDRVTLRARTNHEDGTGGNQIILRGSVHNISLCCRVLQEWLCDYATEYLQERTFSLAARYGFTVKAVRVRGQRSRWGSCSRLGNINLNYRLIVLETALIDYLILHELCHLRHMNHSADFKACLHSYETRWQHFEKALNSAWRTLPLWIVHKAKK